jgi:hypothetical protein
MMLAIWIALVVLLVAVLVPRTKRNDYSSPKTISGWGAVELVRQGKARKEG